MLANVYIFVPYPAVIWSKLTEETPPVTAIAVPAPSGMGPLAWRYTSRLTCKVRGFARGSLPEGAVKAVRL